MSNKKIELQHNLAKELNLIETARTEPIRPNELLYDRKGHPVAIESNGQILAIIEDEL
jgi:hypothetical protein